MILLEISGICKLKNHYQVLKIVIKKLKNKEEKMKNIILDDDFYEDLYEDYTIMFEHEIKNSSTSEIVKIKLEILENYILTMFNDNSERELAKLLKIVEKELESRGRI